MKNLLERLKKIKTLLPWKNSIPKKTNTAMQFDENKLISLMENFSGAKFQWIKTNKPELLGKLVTCRTIEPRGDRFFAMFDDGSSVDTAQLNTSLLMIHGDMQPLSRAEVESIAGPKRPAPQKQSESAPVQSSSGGPRHFEQAQPAASTSNMFEMFNSEERQIDLKVSISLPDQELLKMMYTNAKDKDKFLSELSDYVFRVINKKVVQASVTSLVVPSNHSKGSRSSSIVNITEIHEE
jgi:hypothetical protein